jgi:hypothetical protein
VSYTPVKEFVHIGHLLTGQLGDVDAAICDESAKLMLQMTLEAIRDRDYKFFRDVASLLKASKRNPNGSPYTLEERIELLHDYGNGEKYSVAELQAMLGGITGRHLYRVMKKQKRSFKGSKKS